MIFSLLAAPSVPAGPMHVKNIKPDSVTVDWLPPKDDGGSPITAYKIQKSEAGAEWFDVDTVEKFKKDYEIKKLTEGKEYKFRVLAINKVGESTPLESDAVTPERAPGIHLYQ